uniref:Uncharacterized protein n=1 Tax=Glossina pallidipes TaxID=7398 RepID=A0A1A9ZMB6_GLOPL
MIKYNNNYGKSKQHSAFYVHAPVYITKVSVFRHLRVDDDSQAGRESSKQIELQQRSTHYSSLRQSRLLHVVLIRSLLLFAFAILKFLMPMKYKNAKIEDNPMAVEISLLVDLNLPSLLQWRSLQIIG